jgi:transglutaminase-like putative cysteine protease
MVKPHRLLRLLYRFLGCSALICFAPNVSHATEFIDNYSQPLSNPFPRQVRFNLTIENPTDQTLADQTVWLYAPVKQTATQELQKLEVSIPYQLEEDVLGNQIVKLQFEKFPPFGTKIVSIKADLLMSATPRVNRLKRTNVFLEHERYIEVDDPLIQTVGASIAASQTVETTNKIYHWVRSSLSYAGFIAEDLGAKYAVDKRRGDCTEYAYLVTALARVNSIAARPLGGYVMDKNGSPKADEYHNWAEVYVDGSWRLMDAQKENNQTNIEQYVAMQVISQKIPNSMEMAHRFRVKGKIAVHVN